MRRAKSRKHRKHRRKESRLSRAKALAQEMVKHSDNYLNVVIQALYLRPIKGPVSGAGKRTLVEALSAVRTAEELLGEVSNA